MCVEQNISTGSIHASFHNFHNVSTCKLMSEIKLESEVFSLKSKSMSFSHGEPVKKLWPEGALLKALLGIAQQFISLNEFN